MLGHHGILRMAFVAVVAGAGCLQVGEQAPGTTGVRDAALEQDSLAPIVALVPTTRPALDDFLLQRKYLGFASESGAHQSEGTHYGLVRTYLNPLLYDSLAANNRVHPQGAAAVMELYRNGQQLAGWAVLVKVAAQGNAGDGYFWFEAVDGKVNTNSRGEPTCAQCHELGRDLVLTRLPLR